MKRCRQKSALWVLMLLLGGQSALAQQSLFAPKVEMIQPNMSLREQVQARGFAWGSPMFIRIFKKENVLEVWMRDNDGKFRLFRDYPICVYSGDLGPKIRIGDKQSPEGVYHVDRKALRPHSRYHRGLELNFPNTFDRAHGRTGKYLMIHGDCVSTGCYAMGDKPMEEIYNLTESALKHGQTKIAVHAFPFRLTREQLANHRFHPQHDFWVMLAPIYQAFETLRVPPEVKVSEKSYLLVKPNEPQSALLGTQVATSGINWQTVSP